ncbi:hypothetical protein LAZ67_18002301 [Cordylochernes scorpioides]|uniref:DDE-1 domain-containing protein n=1 Tax=Cordylochernes scorpioides TaxID=51811 RepID=A0ABY6LIN4_9ARAC|nr:hypothetical protein LAZ67_18002301 [Cordylochernes scorpioides]
MAVFLALGVCISVQLGAYPTWMFFQCFTAIALFYCAHWQTYVSGILRFIKIPVIALVRSAQWCDRLSWCVCDMASRFDVTEVQLSIITIYLISAVFSPSVWMYPIPYIQLELRLLPAILALAVMVAMLYSNFHIILSGGAGKNGSTVAGTSVLSPFIPLALVVLPAFIIYQKSPTLLYEEHPCLYILTFGLCLVKVIIRLVIAHMTRSELEYFDSVLLGPALLFLNQYFNTFFNEYFVLWAALMANKKAWVTTAIFTEWFNKCFVPEVENYMKEMGLEFKILLILDNAPDHVALAIAEIKSQTLNACWKAAWPECVSKRNESNRTTIVTSDIISIAKEIGGEGFDDFGEHDIEELLVDEALNDDDILESMVDTTKDFETVDSELEDVTPLDEKLLREGLQLSERALKFQRDLKFCMSGYRELYKELVKPSQRLITDYLVKEKKITEVPKEALPCRSDDVILSSNDESDLAPIHKRVYALADLFQYCSIVCRQICRHLHIQLFTLTPAPSRRH